MGKYNPRFPEKKFDDDANFDYDTGERLVERPKQSSPMTMPLPSTTITSFPPPSKASPPPVKHDVSQPYYVSQKMGYSCSTLHSPVYYDPNHFNVKADPNTNCYRQSQMGMCINTPEPLYVFLLALFFGHLGWHHFHLRNREQAVIRTFLFLGVWFFALFFDWMFDVAFFTGLIMWFIGMFEAIIFAVRKDSAHREMENIHKDYDRCFVKK